MRIYLLTLILCINFFLASCGGGSSSSDNSSANNIAPIASIVPITSVNERSTIIIDGSASSDSDGTIMSYMWMIDEPDNVVSISLNNQTQAIAEIELGEVTETTDLMVKLVVTDNADGRSEDSMIIRLEEIDFDMLPPNPGVAGNEGVTGIDTDADNVRDDVEHSIYFLYPENKVTRDYQTLMAYSQQKALLASLSDDDIDDFLASEFRDKARFCFREMMNLDFEDPATRRANYDEGQRYFAEVSALMLNTRERERAFDIYLRGRSGSVSISKNLSEPECIKMMEDMGA